MVSDQQISIEGRRRGRAGLAASLVWEMSKDIAAAMRLLTIDDDGDGDDDDDI